MKLRELTKKELKKTLSPRIQTLHKNDCGHVVIAGGDLGYSGAILMASRAAMRSGAGLVSVATHRQHSTWLSLYTPEVMFHGIESSNQLDPLLKKMNVVALGPGLGQSEWSLLLYQNLIHCGYPMVVDADALTILAKNPFKKNNWILTPHPGEAAKLLQCSVDEIQKDRVDAVTKLQKKYGGVVILKGWQTLIAYEDQVPSICPYGNPGMATAGMGDVLTGIIAGLLAQKIRLDMAAECGVIIHALAGDLAAKDGERGLMATDLFAYIHTLVNP